MCCYKHSWFISMQSIIPCQSACLLIDDFCQWNYDSVGREGASENTALQLPLCFVWWPILGKLPKTWLQFSAHCVCYILHLSYTSRSLFLRWRIFCRHHSFIIAEPERSGALIILVTILFLCKPWAITDEQGNNFTVSPNRHTCSKGSKRAHNTMAREQSNSGL